MLLTPYIGKMHCKMHRTMFHETYNQRCILRAYRLLSSQAPKPNSKEDSEISVLSNLSCYLWPSHEDGEKSKKTSISSLSPFQVKSRVALSMGLLFASKGLNISVPYLFKDIVDNLSVNAATASSVIEGAASQTALNIAAIDPTVLAYSPVIMVLTYGLTRCSAAGFSELKNAIFSKVANNAIRLVSRNIFEHLHKLDMQFHLNRNTGELARTIDRGTRSINFSLNSMLFNVVPTVFEVGLVAAMLTYTMGSTYAIISTATVAAYTVFTIKVSDWRTHIRKDMNQQEAKASGKVVDSLINYETVALFGNQQYEVDSYDTYINKYRAASVYTQESLSALNFGQNAIFTVGVTAIMWMTCTDILAGNATIGDLVLVNGLLVQLAIPLNFIGSVYRELRQAAIDMSALFKLQESSPIVTDGPNAKPLVWREDQDLNTPRIKFDNVKFSYPANPERAILDGLTCDIPAGKKVAIVGSSGSGKSTFYRLLYRFYDPQEGTISVDGQDIRSITLESLRSNIGVVPQETVLFNDSIGYNIAYGNLHASPERLTEVIKLAQLDALIGRLHEGLETKVGERGLKLSGGEKQRVAIARCLLKDAPIVVLDEATSALDTETEQAVQGALLALHSSTSGSQFDRVGDSRGRASGGKTTQIVIAHRLSTVQDADIILVLEAGKVVEQGSHLELLKQPNGRYAELVIKMSNQENTF